MQSRPKSILAIDRGSKYVGLAYQIVDQNVIFPIGYLLNDQMIFFNIGDLITRHNVSIIVVGQPSKQKDIQEKIQKFMTNLNYIIDSKNIEIELIDEDYTSVQSGEIISKSTQDTQLGEGFKKNLAEDTVSAMLILDRWNKSKLVS